MKKLVLISLLVVAMGVIGFSGCEKPELANPKENQNLTSRIGEANGCTAGIVEPVILDEYVTAKLDSLFSRNNIFAESDSWMNYNDSEGTFTPIFKVIRNNDEFLEIGGNFDFDFDKYCIVGGIVWGRSTDVEIIYKELKVYEDCSSVYFVRKYNPTCDYLSIPALSFWNVFLKESVENDPELIVEEEYENE